MTKTALKSVLLIVATTFSLGVVEAHENDGLAVHQSKLKAQEIIKIARAARSGDVSKMVVEKEKGKIIWDVEIVTKSNQVYDLEIDGKSGKVVENKLDKSDKEDEEDDD